MPVTRTGYLDTDGDAHSTVPGTDMVPCTNRETTGTGTSKDCTYISKHQVPVPGTVSTALYTITRRSFLLMYRFYEPVPRTHPNQDDGWRHIG